MLGISAVTQGILSVSMSAMVPQVTPALNSLVPYQPGPGGCSAGKGAAGCLCWLAPALNADPSTRGYNRIGEERTKLTPPD